MNETITECLRCVYDNHIPGIYFDDQGICNYCKQYEEMDRDYPTGNEGEQNLVALVKQIKKNGKGKAYDCVVGVSGGCDSSYLLVWAKQIGLRPLAVHFDNTWNSKIAVENIKVMLDHLNIDLYTHVVDNEEYCDLFKSFLKASVPEIDTPADIGLATTHYLAARKYKIKYILEGHSFRTEGISPPGWFYMDGQYINTIQKQFGRVKMKTFPNLNLWRWIKWMAIDGIRKVRPLYYMDYNKEKTKDYLSKNFGWKWYGGHHMENRSAYFTNNYYLPNKFKIDLRYCEYSALIRSGQLTREDARDLISKPKEFDVNILAEVKKRLNFSNEEFEKIMNSPANPIKIIKHINRHLKK